MQKSWLATVEQIMFAAMESKARTLAVAGVRPQSGVSTVCELLAASYARAGDKTLLIRFARDGRGGGGWVPGDAAEAHIDRDHGDYDTIVACAVADKRSRFNNVAALRNALATDFAAYRVIIMDLPPIDQEVDGAINPLASARVADGVILVCVTGRDRQQEIAAAASALQAAGACLSGVVMNDSMSPAVGVQLAEKLKPIGAVPGISWLRRRAQSSTLLNSRL